MAHDKPELYPEEKLLSYSKYYYLEPDPMNPVVLQAIREPLAEEDCLAPEDIAQMFRPGYDHVPLGWRNWDGGSYATMYAQIPGVTTDMVCWWFTWMFVPPTSVPREHGNLRYKLWHPTAHFDHYPADEASWAQLTDETIPIRRRRRGVREVAMERVDAGATAYKTLDMRFRDYSELALPQECWDYIEAAGTLNILANDHNVTLQFFRDTSYGCEIILRTWRGFHLDDEGRIVPTPGYATPTPEHVKDDILHTLTEMPHLAKLLPGLYAEEGSKPIGAY